MNSATLGASDLEIVDKFGENNILNTGIVCWRFTIPANFVVTAGDFGGLNKSGDYGNELFIQTLYSNAFQLYELDERYKWYTRKRVGDV